MDEKELLKSLKEVLHYDPETGIFKWKVKRAGVRKNSIAGTDHNGYIRIKINGKTYRAHRLAWLFTYGYWPNEIDHKDRIKNNNKLKNLRECTRSANMYNVDTWSHNTSGVKGVFRNKNHKKWYAYIGKRYIGCFDTKKEAAEARQRAEEKMT